MNIPKLAALAIAAIVVTGCATTAPHTAQFNPNNKGMFFNDGKSYLLPYAANIGKLMSGSDITALNKLQIPHNCKSGDLRWMATEWSSYMKNNINEISAEDLFRAGFRNQYIGCSSPLSAMEYDYYKTAQVQRLQQVRHNQNLQMQQNAINAINRPTSCITNNGYTTCF